uniref:Uncharacterized protein n=1 Tax=Anguilla anguilla TaxID=7936 RepID=A0A0E9UIQ1_ANGAN
MCTSGLCSSTLQKFTAIISLISSTSFLSCRNFHTAASMLSVNESGNFNVGLSLPYKAVPRDL